MYIQLVLEALEYEYYSFRNYLFVIKAVRKVLAIEIRKFGNEFGKH